MTAEEKTKALDHSLKEMAKVSFLDGYNKGHNQAMKEVEEYFEKGGTVKELFNK
jgi:hypothetical protein